MHLLTLCLLFTTHSHLLQHCQRPLLGPHGFHGVGQSQEHRQRASGRITVDGHQVLLARAAHVAGAVVHVAL